MIQKASSCFTLIGALALALLFAPQAQAVKPTAGQGPGNHLRILEVHTNSVKGVIEILGESFDFGGLLTVSLGTLGDITAICTLIDPTEIECVFGGKGDPAFPDSGDYLLTVATGNGQSQGDEYDLTIGTFQPTVACPCFSESDVEGFGNLYRPALQQLNTTTIEQADGCGFATVTVATGSKLRNTTCSFHELRWSQEIGQEVKVYSTG